MVALRSILNRFNFPASLTLKTLRAFVRTVSNFLFKHQDLERHHRTCGVISFINVRHFIVKVFKGRQEV